jgi:3-oxoacyl-[acyl-carrier-protein] synthase-1/3-oxoacyl-[acyl-carrier-protein] synthase II
VLAGGYDALSLFVAAGFEAIRATTASRPNPFRRGRDGMALGEGACVLAIDRAPSDVDAQAGWAQLLGFGAADDAVHITAPDRTGAGLARAAAAALADAGVEGDRVELVSAHGTATPYNDAMEARAIAAACPASPAPVVHPYKAEVGHTLGAAGALELLVAIDGLRRRLVPAACGEGELDAEARVRLLERGERGEPEVALKLSAAFGGVNAALAVGRRGRGRPSRVHRPVYLQGSAVVDQVRRAALAELTGVPQDRLARMDPMSQLAVGAVAELAEQVGRDRLVSAGVVQGHGLATLDVNLRFYDRLRTRGARWVDPRLFPATSPNAAAGHCAIVFGLTGPNFAVGSGLGGALEALQLGAELVAAGDAERMVVLATDDVGPAAQRWVAGLDLGGRPLRSGAVAVLLSAEPPVDEDPWRVPDPADLLPQGLRAHHEGGAIGHLALVEWIARCRPSRP